MVKPTASSRLLAAVSAAQLATGVAGMVVALRRRHPYDVLWMHGRADAIARDSILKGTAFSAPVSNLLVQAALTAVVACRPRRGAARALAGLGALQVPGYLAERLVRRRLRPSGWDAVESPLAVAGIGLAGAMAVLGSRAERRDGAVRSPSPARLVRGTLKPLARHFTLYAVNRRPGLPAGSTIRHLAGNYAEAIAREFPGPVAVQGISTACRSCSGTPPSACPTPAWPCTRTRATPACRPTSQPSTRSSPSWAPTTGPGPDRGHRSPRWWIVLGAWSWHPGKGRSPVRNQPMYRGLGCVPPAAVPPGSWRCRLVS